MHSLSVTDGLLQIPEGTRYLRGQQYASRQDISRVIVPKGVGFMEEEVFAECANLEEVVLPEGLTNIGVAAFADCPKLRKINIPTTVKTIGEGAFLGCEALAEIQLPEGLEEISAMAFQNTGLGAVVIPASVKSIHEEAFFECENLTHADVLGEATIIEENAFGSNYRLTSGYIAPGYPKENSPPSELLYTLLWCSCPEKHQETVCERAEAFIAAREDLIMEWVFRQQNIPALHTLVTRHLLPLNRIDSYLRKALDQGQTEMTALLLSAKTEGSVQEDFEL